jgi:adenine phosphoribosyltransferase
VARRCPVFASEALAYFPPPFTFMAQSNFSDFLKARVRTIPGWPKAGVNFRDVTTLFHDPEAFRVMVEAFALDCTQQRIDLIAAVDARGFIVGGALAYQLHKPFVLVRKKGKLPHKTISADYALEYGTATVEIHADACKPGDRILILDDLIATGGTLLAATQLFRRLGGVVVGVAGIIDLPELGGSAKLRAAGLNVHTLCEFSENE